MRKVILYLDPEDGGWIALVPSLPGCHAQGDSREEALASARAAIEYSVEVARMRPV